jgi:DnaJ-class molecular chaperone
MDYYAILGINRDGDVADVQKAYRNLALKWHPLRCDEADAQSNFDEVSEAFEVLSDYELRAVFDKFGEVAIKEGVSDGNGGFIGGNYAYGFNGNDIFASFFGTSNPFASIVEAATAIDVNAPEVVEPSAVQTIFESITLEDVHQGASKTVSLGGRAMTYTVQPGFTSGSTLVFKDDGSGIGPLSFLFCRDDSPG